MGLCASSPDDDKRPDLEDARPPASDGKTILSPSGTATISPEEHEKRAAAAKKQRRRLSVSPEHVGDISQRPGQPSPMGNIKTGTEAADTKLGFSFAASTQKGFVPYNRNKQNQDRYFTHNSKLGFMYVGVFDGHGEFGHHVSQVCKTAFPKALDTELAANEDIPQAITNAVENVAAQLDSSNINCHFSGTTAVFSVITPDREMYVANIGDSRCVWGSSDDGKSIKARPLSFDHKPDNPEEKKRILAAGGRVDTMRGPPGEDNGPYRVWLATVDVPGLAMSRSIGDGLSHTVGVIHTPEIHKYTIGKDQKFAVWASDGVWEFLSDEQVIDLVWKDVQEDQLKQAMVKLVKRSTQEWQREEEVIDDITCVVVKFNE